MPNNNIPYTNPIPTDDLHSFPRSGQGVRFLFKEDEDLDDEMTWQVLAYCVRTDERYAFADGDTIEEASSHTDQELWTDVVVPAIERGDIEVYVWGEQVFAPVT